MSAAETAAALGLARRSGGGWRARCPVHQSGGPSLALKDSGDGVIVHCFAGCDPRDIRVELRRLGLLSGGSHSGRPRHPPVQTDHGDRARQHRDFALRIWDNADRALDTPVTEYLAGRHLILVPPPTLRYAPALKSLDGAVLPAMVAKVEHVERGFVGVHRTWICRDGAGNWVRRDRALLGPIRGGAIRLAPAAETLMVGEGIETCLAAMQETGRPAWAALSTSGLIRLVLPPEVRVVIILADNDRNGAGERAAYKAGRRWLAEGRRVRIAIAPIPGTDMNNVLAGPLSAQAEEGRDAAP